jgi:hypothetical protein
MSLLGAEAEERLGQVLSGEAPLSPPEEAAPTPPEPQIETPQEVSSPAQDVNQSANVEPELSSTEPSVEATEETREGHGVPYSRFKQVLEARNSHRDEVSALRSRLADLEAQQASLVQQRQAAQQMSQQAPVPSDSDYGWLDDMVGEASDQVAADQANDPRVSALAQRVEAQDVQLHKIRLEREVAEALQRFPDVNRRQLLQGVYHNPQADVMGLAEQYTTFVASVEERAIARYLENNPQAAEAMKAAVEASTEAAAPNAPPRPQKSSSGAPSIWASDERPQSVEEGSALLREFLKEHNPFA